MADFSRLPVKIELILLVFKDISSKPTGYYGRRRVVLNLNLNVTVLITKNWLSGKGKVNNLFMSNSDWIGRDL